MLYPDQTRPSSLSTARPWVSFSSPQPTGRAGEHQNISKAGSGQPGQPAKQIHLGGIPDAITILTIKYFNFVSCIEKELANNHQSKMLQTSLCGSQAWSFQPNMPYILDAKDHTVGIWFDTGLCCQTRPKGGTGGIIHPSGSRPFPVPKTAKIEELEATTKTSE